MQISIHAPARGATVLFGFHSFHLWISIHAPARGATFEPALITFEQVISIHAPARGATTLGYSFRCYRSDFNPRSREGSDRFADISTFGPSNFNPRSREGSDVLIGWFVAYVYTISIHAPARGATAFIDIFSFTVRLYFISSHQ